MRDLSWVRPGDAGLYVAPTDCWIDPGAPVERAWCVVERFCGARVSRPVPTRINPFRLPLGKA
ncbi:MAG: hypothetical protein JSS15_06575 [Proteobacteria bacterium]|nr:hypothetical protein [Pseudomonadota bacterium]